MFISYSHDSKQHQAAVIALANRLRLDGVDAWVDAFDPHPAEGWPRWMQRQLEQADFILLVCTSTYRRRFEGTERTQLGLGVTWEGMLAQQALYDGGTKNNKLVPVTLAGGADDDVPLSVRSFSRYSLPVAYDELYRHLTAQPAVTAQPLGCIRGISPADPEARLSENPIVSDGLPPVPPEVPSAPPGGQVVNNHAEVRRQYNVIGAATFNFGNDSEQ